MASSNSRKRARLSIDEEPPDVTFIRQQRAGFLSSISRSISPPRNSRKSVLPSELNPSAASDSGGGFVQAPKKIPNPISLGASMGNGSLTSQKGNETASAASTKSTYGINKSKIRDMSSSDSNATIIQSPFKLTQIRDLDPEENVDTFALQDILGNPLIKEAWVFNFCFDIDWMMKHFDEDVRDLVQVKVVHGSWRNEDQNKINIDEACRRWPNVKSLAAYLPDAFGTHHSKMFILFTHDEQAEVVIHTANMLAQDWTNMTQAVWRSPSLPKLKSGHQRTSVGPIGSGSRFKQDLLAYLQAYGYKLREVAEQLDTYDFSGIRGALVASVPSKLKETDESEGKLRSLWGYPRLREVLTELTKKLDSSFRPYKEQSDQHVVVQVSSIATLPQAWLNTFQGVTRLSNQNTPKNLSIVFPTAANVRQSLDGYAAGISIHTKAQSNSHLQQINYLRPYLRQWTRGPPEISHSGRDLAAPHIKTYIQFDSTPSLTNPSPGINWALLTSANLSTQAWGSLPRMPKDSKDKKDAYVHIQSFEIGVLVWPSLFSDLSDNPPTQISDHPSRPVRMVPVFGKDTPDPNPQEPHCTLVGLRMPYDLPLTSYQPDELPWSPQSLYREADRHGNVWPPTA